MSHTERRRALVTTPLRQILCVPYDDAYAPLMALVASAKRKIRVLAFDFGISALADALIAKHVAGVDVALVMDFTQSVQLWEAPLIARMQTAGVPVVIGTSIRAHKIIHSKLLIVDDKVAFSGSANLTTSGLQTEDNIVFIDRSPAVVKTLAANWQKVHDDVQAIAKLDALEITP